MHINYTAKDGGETFRNDVNEEIASLMNEMITHQNGNGGFNKLISLKHDYPTDFYKLQNGTGGTYSIFLGNASFPYFTREFDIKLKDVPGLYDGSAAVDESGNLVPLDKTKSTNGTGEIVEEDWTVNIDYDADEVKSLSDILILIKYELG
jgi:hypothetical protein